MPKNYLVTWEIDVECDTPEEAALEAWNLVRREHSTANVFTVLDQEGGSTKIDLEEYFQEHGYGEGDAPK